MTTSAAPVLTIRSPVDLLDAVPFLLGFHPRDSAVLVGLNGGVVDFTMRVDLDDLDIGSLLGLCALHGVDEAVAVIYSDMDDAAAIARIAADQLIAAATAADICLLDALLVRLGRWWSLRCTDPLCCPAEGSAFGGTTSATTATAVLAGMVALPDRNALDEALRGPSPQDARRVRRQLEAAQAAATSEAASGRLGRRQRSLIRRIFAAARQREGASSTELVEAELVQIGLALTDTSVRDSLWLAVDGRRITGRALWHELARGLPPPWSAPALFLFGWSAWRDGNGALARVATEKALRDDPAYTAADLLQSALDSGLDPRRTPRLRLPRSR